MISTAGSTSDSVSPEAAPAASPPPTQQTWENPVHEAERRFADQAPLWPVAHAAGLQNQRDIWADAKIKRRMDRLKEAQALGVEDALKDGNEEVPGEINIKGDETNYHYYPAPPAPAVVTPTVATAPAAPAPTPTPTPIATSPPTTVQRIRTGAGKLAPIILGGALLGTGVGGTMLYHYLTDRPSSVTTITQPGGQFEYRYGIQQRPTPTVNP